MKAAGEPTPKYDLWEISVDGGVLFIHATTDRTGIELGQGGFEVVSEEVGTELSELVAALGAAERLPDPEWNRSPSVSDHPSLSVEFLKEHADRLNWSSLTPRRGHDEDVVEAFGDRIAWRLLGMNVKVSEAQLRRYADRSTGV